MATAIYTHPDCALHEMGAGHPESPMRLKAILAALEASGLAGRLSMREAPEAREAAEEAVHGMCAQLLANPVIETYSFELVESTAPVP